MSNMGKAARKLMESGTAKAAKRISGAGQMSDADAKMFTENLSKYTRGIGAAANGYTKADRGGSWHSRQASDFSGESPRGKMLKAASRYWNKKSK